METVIRIAVGLLGLLVGAVMYFFFKKGLAKKAGEALKKLQDELAAINEKADKEKEELKHDLDSKSDSQIADMFHDAFGRRSVDGTGKRRNNNDNSGGGT